MKNLPLISFCSELHFMALFLYAGGFDPLIVSYTQKSVGMLYTNWIAQYRIFYIDRTQFLDNRTETALWIFKSNHKAKEEVRIVVLQINLHYTLFGRYPLHIVRVWKCSCVLMNLCALLQLTTIRELEKYKYKWVQAALHKYCHHWQCPHI